MDINKIKKYADSEYDIYNISRAVTEAKNEIQDKEQGRDIVMSDYFKTLREPIIKQQKESDKKQDELIEQLRDNQEKIVQAIEYDPKKAITYYGKKLPELDFEDEEEKDVDEEEEEKPSTSKKTRIVNLDKGINERYKNMLKEKGYDLPSEIFEKKLDVDNIMDKVKSKIKRSEDYLKRHSTKKGSPLKKLTKIEKTTFERNKIELEYFNDYLKRLEDVKTAPKYIGEGVRRYKQPKRNAYKITDNQYGGLLIDVPELLNKMRLNAYRGGRLIYEANADKSLIDLLTKRYNPKTKYSMNAVKIFNDLNMLSNMPKHQSSGKSRMIGSSVMYYQDPKQLADRIKILIGSMVAGNNSPVLKNDLSQINDEMLRIGAIDKTMHEKMYNRFVR